MVFDAALANLRQLTSELLKSEHHLISSTEFTHYGSLTQLLLWSCNERHTNEALINGGKHAFSAH